MIFVGFLLSVGAASLYLPLAGVRVELPEIEALLAPDVPHDRPTLVDTGDHVYYRVRLREFVRLGFSRAYFDSLRRRGAQFRANVHRPFGPGPALEGWEAAMAVEKSVSPYVLAYRRSTDRKTPSFPVKLRWPWLYLRLGRDVLDARSVILWPRGDSTTVSPAIPRFPGAAVTDTLAADDAVHIVFLAPATEIDVLRHYQGVFADHFGGDFQARERAIAAVPTCGALWMSLERPRRIQVKVDATLYTDDPLVIFSSEAAARIPKDSDPQQPVTLTNLPPLTRFSVRLRYADVPSAQRALKALLGPLEVR